MPVKVRKTRGGYRVTDAGRMTAKGTTRTKAERQAKLLRGVAHGWKPSKSRRRA
jgi:hypothetical protein